VRAAFTAAPASSLAARPEAACLAFARRLRQRSVMIASCAAARGDAAIRRRGGGGGASSRSGRGSAALLGNGAGDVDGVGALDCVSTHSV